MKDAKLASLVLAEVLYLSEEAVESDDANSTNFPHVQLRTDVTPKYYVGRSAQSVLSLRGADAALTRLEESLRETAPIPEDEVPIPEEGEMPPAQETDSVAENVLEARLQPESSSKSQTADSVETIKPHPYNKITVGWSMQVMDVMFKASFSEFVSDERNVDCIGQHLLPLIKDYKMRQGIHHVHLL